MSWNNVVPFEMLEPQRDDLAVPSTLTITSVSDNEHVVRGGDDGQLLVAVFASKNAAEHWVRYCVEQQKTFAGVRP